MTTPCTFCSDCATRLFAVNIQTKNKRAHLVVALGERARLEQLQLAEVKVPLDQEELLGAAQLHRALSALPARRVVVARAAATAATAAQRCVMPFKKLKSNWNQLHNWIKKKGKKSITLLLYKLNINRHMACFFFSLRPLNFFLYQNRSANII